MELEIRDLEYVITLSEELNFTRAAARLGIAQPPLSRAIARLERRLGVRLFARTSRSVALTAAGAAFVADGRSIVAAMRDLVDRVGSAEGRRELVIAARPATGSGLLHDMLEHVADLREPIPVRVLLTRDPGAAVRTGGADVALLCVSTAPGGLTVEGLAEQPTVVLLPENHSLATSSTLRAEEVRALSGHMAECPELPLDELVDVIRLGGGSVFASHDVGTRIGDHVVAIPVPDAPATTFGLAYPPSPTHPRLPEFLRVARRIGYSRLGIPA